MYVYVWNVRGAFMDWVRFGLIIVSNLTFDILQTVNLTRSIFFEDLGKLDLSGLTKKLVHIIDIHGLKNHNNTES